MSGAGGADVPVELGATTMAMATRVTIRARPRDGGVARLRSALPAALAVFGAVERACTRFDPASPLMRANRSPDRWCRVPAECQRAVAAAHAAYRSTGGRFDPRVFGDLVRLGYDRSMAAGPPHDGGPAALPRPRQPLPEWRPRLRDVPPAVLLGGLPLDLGGIGKGLAVRWAAERLAAASAGFLVEAGGDCYAAGRAADGGPWRIGVEDPGGARTPVAVLAAGDAAVATSSVRVRSWHRGGIRVHHLVDPADGRPGGAGLASVTVLAADPALAEVWSKVLFLAGADGVAEAARRADVAALWVGEAGTLGWSAALSPALLWVSR